MGERILIGLRACIAPVLAVALAIASLHSYAESKDKKPPKAEPQVPWNKVSGAEQKILTPLEKDWNHLSGTQQSRLISTARQYPKFAPIQQERFQERIKEWAALTPEQRVAAREKYRNLSKLPPAKQHELREKWSEKKEKTQSQTAAEPSPPAEQPK
ncbi:MAG: DUF3106 domain-containing protein [Betaproteobacteria bacterium]